MHGGRRSKSQIAMCADEKELGGGKIDERTV